MAPRDLPVHEWHPETYQSMDAPRDPPVRAHVAARRPVRVMAQWHVFAYNLKPSNRETTFQVLKTNPAFLPSDHTTHTLSPRNHLREEGFSLRHACQCGQTPGLGSLALDGRPGSVGGAGHPAAAGGSWLCSGYPHGAGAPGKSRPSQSLRGVRAVPSPVPCCPWPGATV